MGDENWYLDYCTYSDADRLFEECKQLDFLDHPKMEGTSSRCRRNIGVYSDDAPGYHLSKQNDAIIPAVPLPDFLSKLLHGINEHFDENFNLLLVNEYANQYDSIGPHHDSPHGNGLKAVVTLSLGATRTYRLRSRESGKIAMDCEMKHGDILIMSNTFQLLYEHEIPVSETPCGTRISITTRHIVETRKFYHKRRRQNIEWKPKELKICLRCKQQTDARSGVCVKCYELQTFQCPECQQPTGAPWMCSLCWVKHKQLNDVGGYLGPRK